MNKPDCHEIRQAVPNTAEGLRELIRHAVADVLNEDKERNSSRHSTATSQEPGSSSQLPTLLTTTLGSDMATLFVPGSVRGTEFLPSEE